MNKLKVFLIVFGFILAIGLIIPSLFYIVNFLGGKLSNDPQIWGTFGDYFGGIINPILALANLIIFIKLTLIVADMQDKSTQQALNYEKKILTSGLMHDSVKELSEVLNSLGQKIIASRQQTDWEILKVQQTVTTFGNNYTHLFSDIDNRVILNGLNSLLNAIRTKPYNKQNFVNAFETYLNEKDRFIQSLHRQTISKLDN
jgi:hypothetical protein